MVLNEDIACTAAGWFASSRRWTYKCGLGFTLELYDYGGYGFFAWQGENDLARDEVEICIKGVRVVKVDSDGHFADKARSGKGLVKRERSWHKIEQNWRACQRRDFP